MFELGPEKILIILAAVFIFLGPKELPAAARTIGALTRQLRSWQDSLQTQVDSALTVETDPTDPQPRTPSPTNTPHPEDGDPFR